MSQKHVLTAFAIMAVTGAVSVPNSLAVAWPLGVSEQHVVGRGVLEWNPLIHKVADAYSGMMTGTGATKPDASSQYGDMPGGQSRQPGESNYGSPSNDPRYGGKSSDPSYQKESSGTPTSPFSESIYGGVTTPSADPSVRELNRDPSR